MLVGSLMGVDVEHTCQSLGQEDFQCNTSPQPLHLAMRQMTMVYIVETGIHGQMAGK
jgi:hypothetical protein